MDDNKKPVLEDDTKEAVLPLVTHRIPWLLVGLIGGMVATIISSRFEHLLSSNISLVFFIPVIVYMADAVGTQTETIYIRNLVRKQAKFSVYLFKESLLGIFLGLLFGSGIGLFAYIWFNSFNTALTVGSAMFASMSVAPAVALIITSILQKEHTDPALGAGPFATVVQDLISLLIYLLVASVVIFR